MPSKCLGTSKSESTLSVNSRLSNKRRDKLTSLREREELKDALCDKFKARFGHNSQQRGEDEVSVASLAIQHEVEQFVKKANASESNLGRLEKRIQSRARWQSAVGEDDVGTNLGSISGVSAYTGVSKMSNSRSLASMAGERILRGEAPADWSQLDEYASYVHQQDALRQKLGVQALQRKLRTDLDCQVAERREKRVDAIEEERRGHTNMLVELERWKASERARAEEMKTRLQNEKQDRNEQLDFERKLKQDANNRKKKEEAELVHKMVNEMESEQQRLAKKKADQKQALLKIIDENQEGTRRRNQAKKEQQDKEAAAMKEYSRILDEKEEQRADELATRMQRQKNLMEELQANVQAQAKQSGDNDVMAAKMQQDELERHFVEAEQAKQKRLMQLKLETQAYQFRQMEEKGLRKQEEKELQSIQAQILEKDTEEYNQIEQQKFIEKKRRLVEHRLDVEGQIASRATRRAPKMSEAEIKMNKKLLGVVSNTLALRDESIAQTEECGD